ncbi:hypothetical protein VTN00DRAFT_3190 [Thermoascus crustaceus]|uniref:uncharacterized protein n=1 Tax=Thermoascus crustaceus TaxID=5088 RepID=UPI0037424765
MRFTLVSLTAALFAVAATAAPADRLLARGEGCEANSEPHCCQTISDTKNSTIASTLSKYGVPPEMAKGPVGLACTPISTIVTLGQRCNANTVCCSNNNYNGLINLGCNPININL